MGININGDKLNHLRFADDIMIIAHAVQDFEILLQELDNTSRKCGLKINMKKQRSWQEPQDQQRQYM